MITDASFDLLENLILIAADPEAARRRVAEVRAACQAARAEAEAWQAKAETARAEAEAERAKLDKERATLDKERAELKQRGAAIREGERGLRMLQDSAARARENARYVGPPIVPRPSTRAQGAGELLSNREEGADAPPLVTSEFAQGPPILPRRGLGGRYAKRPEQEISR